MDVTFEQGARRKDVEQALRLAGCVLFDDETWQPDNPFLDGRFEETGLGVGLPTSGGDRPPADPAYFPEGQEPPAAWCMGAVSVVFRTDWAPPLPELQNMLAFMEAFQKLSPARFALRTKFLVVLAERTAQGLVLHPQWHVLAGREVG